jgi:trk/ktr system potassium uptake protein
VPAAWIGQTLVEIDVRRRYSVSVVAIRRQGRVRMGLQSSLEDGDVLMVLGTSVALTQLAALV